MDFEQFFRKAFSRERDSGFRPYDYQNRLAEGRWPDLVDVPTGLGKTAAVTLAWLYRRRIRNDTEVPRRLIWCLPMRVLVEQTHENVRAWLEHLGLLGEPGDDRVSVHLLMGGEPDVRRAGWAEYPEEEAILIGTQDMLLSRALMRGYGMSRYQWPVHFALLHNDSLWVFDEVQLMGAGLATSAQLDAFRRAFPLGRSSRSIWLSATLNRDWLATVDLAPYVRTFETLGVSGADREQAGERISATKHLRQAAVVLSADNSKQDAADYLQVLAETVLAVHKEGTQTLVILNRVDRAQGLFQRLSEQRPGAADLLVHARFRPAERREIERRLRDESAGDRIVVATQAIEAGVDISSRTLFTELAPWASLVQRFGRCNRYGEYQACGGASVHWIDIDDEADLLPYDAASLDAAREKLTDLERVGPADLPPTDEPSPLVPVIRRKDMLDLFNTDPDLSGFDVDVSDYIRDTGAPGLQVFWREFDDPNEPDPQLPPKREELCPISIGQARALGKRRLWRWDSLPAHWEPLRGGARPGMTLLLAAAEGGYDLSLGFSGRVRGRVDPVSSTVDSEPEAFGADTRSFTRRAVGLPAHLAHVAAEATELCRSLGEKAFDTQVVRAGRWHDVGKAHETFQGSMYRCKDGHGELLAKSDCPGLMRHKRQYFRHELASMLAWLTQHDQVAQPDKDIDLIAYLILAHHGKVRTSLRAMPDEPSAPDGRRFARGVWDGDSLPALDFDGERSAELVLRLALMELGEGEQGRSWAERAQNLLAEHGPFRLAWLETLVRIADWRASAAEQRSETDE